MLAPYVPFCQGSPPAQLLFSGELLCRVSGHWMREIHAVAQWQSWYRQPTSATPAKRVAGVGALQPYFRKSLASSGSTPALRQGVSGEADSSTGGIQCVRENWAAAAQQFTIGVKLGKTKLSASSFTAISGKPTRIVLTCPQALTDADQRKGTELGEHAKRVS
jgi:hypothetical protein